MNRNCKKLSLRALRGERTFREVSKDTGIPVSTIRALEMGWAENYSAGLKHRLADYYGVNFFRLFPEDKAKYEMIMRPEARRLMLEEFCPDLRFEDKAGVTELLNLASLDEVEEIFRSGITTKEAIAVLKALSKKYGLPAPQIKTTK